jgi:putative endonuclease
MYFLYILKSKKNNRFYIGSTNDLERRLQEHNSGKTKSLKYLRPLEMVFSKGFECETEARRMERKLKKFKNREILEKIVSQQKLITGP